MKFLFSIVCSCGQMGDVYLWSRVDSIGGSGEMLPPLWSVDQLLGQVELSGNMILKKKKDQQVSIVWSTKAIKIRIFVWERSMCQPVVWGTHVTS